MGTVNTFNHIGGSAWLHGFKKAVNTIIAAQFPEMRAPPSRVTGHWQTDLVSRGDPSDAAPFVAEGQGGQELDHPAFRPVDILITSGRARRQKAGMTAVPGGQQPQIDILLYS